jgi:hypothetical protein
MGIVWKVWPLVVWLTIEYIRPELSRTKGAAWLIDYGVLGLPVFFALKTCAAVTAPIASWLFRRSRLVKWIERRATVKFGEVARRRIVRWTRRTTGTLAALLAISVLCFFVAIPSDMADEYQRLLENYTQEYPIHKQCDELRARKINVRIFLLCLHDGD